MTDDMQAVPAEGTSARCLLVFLPKGSTPEEVKEGLASVRVLTDVSQPGLVLVDSLSWFETRFASCGNWDSWALEAVTGKSYRSKKPYFQGFVVLSDGRVGQGTAKVVSLALDVRKPVYWLKERSLHRVTGVDCRDETWHIITGGRHE
jgi:hypothetical protein